MMTARRIVTLRMWMWKMKWTKFKSHLCIVKCCTFLEIYSIFCELSIVPSYSKFRKSKKQTATSATSMWLWSWHIGIRTFRICKYRNRRLKISVFHFWHLKRYLRTEGWVVDWRTGHRRAGSIRLGVWAGRMDPSQCLSWQICENICCHHKMFCLFYT